MQKGGEGWRKRTGCRWIGSRGKCAIHPHLGKLGVGVEHVHALARSLGFAYAREVDSVEAVRQVLGRVVEFVVEM